MRRTILFLSVVLGIGSTFPAQAQAPTQSWVKRFSELEDGSKALALALDTNANVFVTGVVIREGSDTDFGTIKYSTTGYGLWTNYYSGGEEYDDAAKALVLDLAGDVIVTGVKGANRDDVGFATVKYSNGGVPLWTNIYAYSALADSDDTPTGLAVDGSGNVFVTGVVKAGSFRSFATVGYSSAGVPLWTNLLNGPGNAQNRPSALALSPDGDVYVTGTADFDIGPISYLTVKYSSSGAPLWTNYFVSSPGYSEDEARAIAVDAGGDAFVTGSSQTESGFEGYATVKYSSAGLPLWTNLYFGPGDLSDRSSAATALALDPFLNVYVTGYADRGDDAGSDTDYVTIKYSSDGTALWTNQFNRGFVDRPLAITLRDGKVCVTGRCDQGGEDGDDTDYGTVLYSTDGTTLWTNIFDFHTNVDVATAVGLDALGNVFVTGYSIGDRPRGYVTVKLTTLPEPPAWLTIRVTSFDPFPWQFYFTELSWTNAAFHLQSAPTLLGPYSDVDGGEESPYPDYIFPLISDQKYYRLKYH